MSPLAIFGMCVGLIIVGIAVFVLLVLGPVSMASYWSRQEEKHWMERGE